MEQIERTLEVAEEQPEINNKTVRFSSAPWFKPGVEVFIGGSGGIGSWLALFLARQEAKIYLFDMDLVDEVNLAGQCFGVNDIGKTKTGATKARIKEMCGHENVELYEEYTEDSMTNKFIFSAFDNMKARKCMFDKWKAEYKDDKEALFIDGRLLAEIGQVYFVTNDKIEQYEKTLFLDEEVELEDCSYKSTSHCSALIASLIVSGFNNHLTNINAGDLMRELPFSIIYELPLLNFKLT